MERSSVAFVESVSLIGPYLVFVAVQMHYFDEYPAFVAAFELDLNGIVQNSVIAIAADIHKKNSTTILIESTNHSLIFFFSKNELQ